MKRFALVVAFFISCAASAGPKPKPNPTPGWPGSGSTAMKSIYPIITSGSTFGPAYVAQAMRGWPRPFWVNSVNGGDNVMIVQWPGEGMPLPKPGRSEKYVVGEYDPAASACVAPGGCTKWPPAPDEHVSGPYLSGPAIPPQGPDGPVRNPWSEAPGPDDKLRTAGMAYLGYVDMGSGTGQPWVDRVDAVAGRLLKPRPRPGRNDALRNALNYLIAGQGDVGHVMAVDQETFDEAVAALRVDPDNPLPSLPTLPTPWSEVWPDAAVKGVKMRHSNVRHSQIGTGVMAAMAAGKIWEPYEFTSPNPWDSLPFLPEGAAPILMDAGVDMAAGVGVMTGWMKGLEQSSTCSSMAGCYPEPHPWPPDPDPWPPSPPGPEPIRDWNAKAILMDAGVDPDSFPYGSVSGRSPWVQTQGGPHKNGGGHRGRLPWPSWATVAAQEIQGDMPTDWPAAAQAHGAVYPWPIDDSDPDVIEADKGTASRIVVIDGIPYRCVGRHCDVLH